MSTGGKRCAALAGAVAVLVLGALLLRVALASRAAYERGVALEVAEPALAALAYREAITWYYPGNPHAARAIERMWALADAAETAGDLVGARIIVGDLRGALFAIRSVYQPHPEALRECSARLAHLLAATDERVLAGELSVEAALPRYEAAVARDHAPAVGWSVALGVGFVLWIAATFVGIARLVPSSEEDDKVLRWRRALPWFAVSIGALALWLAGAGLA